MNKQAREKQVWVKGVGEKNYLGTMLHLTCMMNILVGNWILKFPLLSPNVAKGQ